MDITIVIPVYNREKSIRRTVDSIPPEYKLILVDNGSSDNSCVVCKEIAKERCGTTFAEEPIRGAAAARNKGLSICTTKWVYFFDSDDVFTGLPTTWDEHKDMICFPVVQVVNGETQVRKYEPLSEASVHICNSMLSTQSVIYKAEWLRSIGAWNNDCMIWNDWELGLRALLNKPRLMWINRKAYHRIFVHHDSITGKGYSQNSDAIVKTMRVAFADIDMLAFDKSERNKCLRALYLRSCIVCGRLMQEGDKASGKKIDKFIDEVFNSDEHDEHPGMLTASVGFILKFCTKMGIRGAWRVARLTV